MKTGFLSRVPCAHCGGLNNLSEAHADLGGDGAIASGITTGIEYACDHCQGSNTVTGVFKAPYIWLRVERTLAAGPASNVPCPRCKKHDNFQKVLAYMPVSDLRGAKNTCPHCGAEQTIVKISEEMRVRVAAR